MDKLVEQGSRRLKWAYEHMPVIQELDRRYREEQPLAGLKIGMALHTEAKTGMLAVTLANAGAKICLASCNPLSTDDSVAAALRDEYGLDVHAKKYETQEEYYNNLNAVLNISPDYVIDDGADLITMAHTKRSPRKLSFAGQQRQADCPILDPCKLRSDGSGVHPKDNQRTVAVDSRDA